MFKKQKTEYVCVGMTYGLEKDLRKQGILSPDISNGGNEQ